MIEIKKSQAYRILSRYVSENHYLLLLRFSRFIISNTETFYSLRKLIIPQRKIDPKRPVSLRKQVFGTLIIDMAIHADVQPDNLSDRERIWFFFPNLSCCRYRQLHRVRRNPGRHSPVSIQTARRKQRHSRSSLRSL